MYFKDDIAQGIVAITVAVISTAIAHGCTNQEHTRGVLDSARAQALNYGIDWPELAETMRGALDDAGLVGLLDMPSGVVEGRNR